MVIELKEMGRALAIDLALSRQISNTEVNYLDLGDYGYSTPINTGRTYIYGVQVKEFIKNAPNESKILLCSKYKTAALDTPMSITWYNNNIFITDASFIGQTSAFVKQALKNVLVAYVKKD